MRILYALIPALLLSGCFDRLDLSGICRPGDPACAEQDYDGDGVINALDNCPTVDNPNQADQDQDGIGDRCEDLDTGEPLACTGSQCLVFERYVVYADDNGDKVVNKGETVRIQVYLKNKSSKPITDLSGTLSSDDSLVSITEPATASWGQLNAGAEDYGAATGNYYYSFELSVDPATNDGHEIPFRLDLSDTYGSSWQLSFSITVDALGADLTFSRVEVYADDNGDKVVNKGETVRIQVYLRNEGASDILDLSAVLSTDDPYVTVSYPDQASWNTLASAEESYGANGGGYYYSYEFEVDPAAPDGHQIPFSLAAVDQYGNSWTLPFTMTVEDLAASLVVGRVEVYSDDNGDDAVNKGETVRLQVFLRNTGTSGILDLSAVLSSEDPYVTVTYPDSASWGNLAAAEEDYGANGGGYYYSYEIEVSEDAPDDHQIQFALAAEDGFGNTWPLDFALTVEDLAANLVFSRVDIYSDDNSNDLAEPGETVRLRVFLRNTGTSKALAVQATLSAADGLSTVTGSAVANWGDMNAAEEDSGSNTGGYYYSYEIDVSAAATAGQTMQFSLAISDTFGNEWNDSFGLQVY